MAAVLRLAGETFSRNPPFLRGQTRSDHRPLGYLSKRRQSERDHLPEISRFLGIIIAMYYNDHRPPHLHAKYGDHEIMVYIEDGLIDGWFPTRALRMVLEWHDLHKEELMDDWLLAEQRRPLNKIEPLE